MSGNTHKSAAVPFINQKGERSMKRVKVERYVAGKKPAYVKDEDEEEEYYTEEEDEGQEDYNEEDEDYEEEEEEVAPIRTDRKLVYSRDDDEDESPSSSSDNERESSNKTGPRGHQSSPIKTEVNPSDEDDEDDDPRFRKLKQIASSSSSSRLIDVQRTQHIQPKYELKHVVLDEDDDEEEIRQRHLLARQRQLELPPAELRTSDLPGSSGGLKRDDDGDGDDNDSQDGLVKQPKRLETEDILKDLKLTGISRPMREKLKTNEEEEAESRRLKEMIEQAKQEASFTREINDKVNQDIKREKEKEALAKGDIGAREMTSVNTDDDDDELAYEEWKLREIKRVLRDRSERMLATCAR